MTEVHSKRHVLLAVTIPLLLLSAAQAAPENDPVQNAIKKGAKYLQSVHRPMLGYSGGSHGMGSATLAGLALLESGIPTNDLSIQNITKYVRDNALAQTRTYEVALTIMYLDRLGQAADRPIIQMLGLRLIGGQNRQGGWEYDCGYALNPPDIARLRTMFNKEATLILSGPKQDVPAKNQPKALPRTDLPVEPSPSGKQPAAMPVKKEADNPPKPDENKAALHPEVARWAKLVNLPTTNEVDFRRNQGGDDNSNTQFAALGVWCARRHGVPTDKALALLALRFRSSQGGDGGWGYKYQYGGGGTTPSMTCAGLIGLAISHGSAINVLRNQKDDAALKRAMEAGEDEAIKKGLKCLGNYITQARGLPPEGVVIPAKNGVNRIKSDGLNINHYFLWSLERVAVIFGLETISKHD
ncbi:MAG: hypothetical protein K8T89_06555, partial [Planctomycetes bacterium]|nr:hypothetical protein [Planctomycetota bacterium]